MPSRKRSPMKKNGTCKHCGHRMKGGWSFFGPTDPDKPSMFSGLFGKKPDVPAPVVPPPAPVVPVPAPVVPVPAPDVTSDEIRKAQPVEPKQAGRGGSEPKPLFGFMGGKSKKSKKSKNGKSKKSKKSKK